MRSRRCQKLKLIWIDYEQSIMGCFDCAFYPWRFSLFDTNVLTGFMILLFRAAPAPRVPRARSLMRTSVRNGLKFFLLFGKEYYFIPKLSFLINNVFGNIFQTPVLKNCFNSWKKHFLGFFSSHLIENWVFVVSALFPFFSVFRLLKLMQLVCL